MELLLYKGLSNIKLLLFVVFRKYMLMYIEKNLFCEEVTIGASAGNFV